MPSFHFSQVIKNKAIIGAYSLLAVLNVHTDAVLGYPLWTTLISSFVLFPLCAAMSVLLFQDTSRFTTAAQRSAILFRKFADILASKGFVRSLLGGPLN